MRRIKRVLAALGMTRIVGGGTARVATSASASNNGIELCTYVNSGGMSGSASGVQFYLNTTPNHCYYLFGSY